MVAVVRVDAELVDDLEGVFAPVLDVDQGVVQRRAVIAGEAVDCCGGFLAAVKTSGVTISSSRRANSRIGEVDAVEGLELFPEVLLQRGAVGDVPAISYFRPRSSR